MKEFLLFDPKLLFYGFTIMFFASYGQTFFISIHNLEIKNFYKLTDGEFGFIYFLATLFSSFVLIGFAKLIDRIDLRLYSFLVSVGLSISCLAMYFSNQSSINLFIIIFGLRFFGQGAMSHAGETTMARYFGNNRGKALSISTSGGKIGLMILPLIVIYMTNLVGWKNIWLLSSLTILIFFIPFLFLTLRNQSLRHSSFSSISKKLVDNKKWKTREIFFDKKFYIYLPISIAYPFIGTGLMFHQIFIITEKGWTLKMLANGFIFLGMFSLIGLIIGGPLVDRFKARRIVIYSLLPLLLAILVLVFFDNYLFMLIYMSLLGVTLGVGTPIIGSLWAELYGLQSIGSVKALLHACMIFFSAISPLVFGYMIDFDLGVLSIALLSLSIIFISTLLPISYKKFNE